MTTLEMSGWPVTGQTELTSPVVKRTRLIAAGAGNDSTCSTGPRAREPSRVRPERSESGIVAPGYRLTGRGRSGRRELAQQVVQHSRYREADVEGQVGAVQGGRDRTGEDRGVHERHHR